MVFTDKCVLTYVYIAPCISYSNSLFVILANGYPVNPVVPYGQPVGATNFGYTPGPIEAMKPPSYEAVMSQPSPYSQQAPPTPAYTPQLQPAQYQVQNTAYPYPPPSTPLTPTSPIPSVPPPAYEEAGQQ